MKNSERKSTADVSRCRYRVLIVDDHRLVAESLGRALGDIHDVVGIAVTGADSLSCASEQTPDIVLLDISLGEVNGLELIHPLLKRAPEARIIVLTMFATPGFQVRAFELGARGFLSKTASTTALLEALDVVGGGGIWYQATNDRPGSVTSRLDPALHLTLRQTEVLRQLSRGRSYKEIANTLGMAENTVDIHLRRIRKMLGGRNAVEVVWRAARHGFIAADLEPPV